MRISLDISFLVYERMKTRRLPLPLFQRSGTRACTVGPPEDLLANALKTTGSLTRASNTIRPGDLPDVDTLNGSPRARIARHSR